MKFFSRIFRRQQSMCCECYGGAPSFRCACSCHRQEDIEYWEFVAFTWLADAIDEREREHAWHRFGAAFPEHARETCGEFWGRIHKTRWHQKHGHKYGHHHHDHDDYC